VNNIRAPDLNMLPGIIFEEAMKFSERVERIYVVLFSKKLAKTHINKKISVYSLPFIFSESLPLFILSVIMAHFMLIPLVTLLILKCKINLIRADDILLTGLPTSIACKITRKPFVIYVAGSLEGILKHKLTAIKVKEIMVALALKVSRIIETFVMKRSDHVFAITSSLIQRAKLLGAKSVSWTPSFLNLSRFKPLIHYRVEIDKR